jgi:hypothetical protein
VAGAGGVGAVLAVARDRAIDETGVLLAERLVADTETLHHAGTEGFEEYVVVADEA